jgi:hypothetical protein
LIFWTKPPMGDRFRICYALDVSLGRCMLIPAQASVGHLHWSCVWIDGELTQEEGRVYFWRPPA